MLGIERIYAFSATAAESNENGVCVYFDDISCGLKGIRLFGFELYSRYRLIFSAPKDCVPLWQRECFSVNLVQARTHEFIYRRG